MACLRGIEEGIICFETWHFVQVVIESEVVSELLAFQQLSAGADLTNVGNILLVGWVTPALLVSIPSMVRWLGRADIAGSVPARVNETQK